MVDAQPIHLAATHEREDLGVGCVEHLGALGAQRHERAHVEEPAVAGLVERDLPTRQAVVLGVGDRVQRVDVGIRAGHHRIERSVECRQRRAPFSGLPQARARVGPRLLGRQGGIVAIKGHERTPHERTGGVADLTRSATSVLTSKNRR